MKRKIKNLCIRVLFKLLDFPEDDLGGKEKEALKVWLGQNPYNPAFNTYIQLRYRRIMKSFDDGMAFKAIMENDRDGLMRIMGQKFELGRLLYYSSKEFGKQKKRLKELSQKNEK